MKLGQKPPKPPFLNQPVIEYNNNDGSPSFLSQMASPNFG